MFDHHHTHHHYIELSPEVRGRLDAMSHKLDRILVNQEQIMATLDQVLSDVTDEGTRLDSLSALIDGLKKQVADALAGTTLPPPVQAKVDAIFAAAEANKGKIDTALNTGVPSSTAPVSSGT